jgi:15-cis-phytoene synthase
MTSVEESYRICNKLNFRFGSTYYWAASILPKQRRNHVHALYAFCRYADDIVDTSGFTEEQDRRQALAKFADRFFGDLDAGQSNDAVLAAVVDTALKLNIDRECFQRFMHSMEMDFTKSTYRDFADLLEYMDGSAAVIGEMMLPVLEPHGDAFEPARNLGIAFQLTNFLRDVGEDLDRGRVYIPQDTLDRFGVDIHERQVSPQWRAAMQFEIDRTRDIYASAEPGIEMLHGRAKTCVAAAHRLYGGILDRIEANNYDVFSRRARVPYWRKLAVLPAAVASR